jgi:hypothetical protein
MASEILYSNRPARCGGCAQLKTQFVWNRDDRTLVCADCMISKVDWFSVIREVNQQLQCPSCGRMRSIFTPDGICLKCEGERRLYEGLDPDRPLTPEQAMFADRLAVSWLGGAQ